MEFTILDDGRKYVKIGNTDCYIIVPNLTEEERQRKWDEICKHISNLLWN